MTPILKGKNKLQMPALMIQMLEISDKDFKTAFMIMLYEAKVNTLELNGRKVLSRDIRIIF